MRTGSASFLHKGAQHQFRYGYLAGSNLLQSLAMPNGENFTPEYDEDGNQTRVRTSTGIWKVLQYNAQNRAIRYESEADSTHIITCVYDSQGRRVEKKEEKEGAAISHVRYVYRGYLQVAAYDLLAEGLPSLWQIIWDPTQEIATRPLAIRANGAYSTYGWDLTKNICETYAGATGFLVHRYAYSPYGLVSIEGDTSYQPLQWSSEVYDAELGLVYYNYRYYNPRDGRWTRRDPMGESLDTYLFLHNRTTFTVDIQGLKESSTGAKDWGESWHFGTSWWHYLFGGGQTVKINFASIDTSGVVVARDFKEIKDWLYEHQILSRRPFGQGVCEEARATFTDARYYYSTTLWDWIVLGTIGLGFTGDIKLKCDCTYELQGEMRSHDDIYDFNMKKTLRDLPRDIATVISYCIHLGEWGTIYRIEIYGNKKINETGKIS